MKGLTAALTMLALISLEIALLVAAHENGVSALLQVVATFPLVFGTFPCLADAMSGIKHGPGVDRIIDRRSAAAVALLIACCALMATPFACRSLPVLVAELVFLLAVAPLRPAVDRWFSNDPRLAAYRAELAAGRRRLEAPMRRSHLLRH